MTAAAYPVHLDGRRDPHLSRWLWLVKWLLVIPHGIVLAFLWIGFAVLTVVAFFAVLFTGRYPRQIFDFNLGVLRWTWRVAFYSYSALGTDSYPPFSLGEEPEYPAQLDIEYPEHLSRGLVLVKWILAIPHLLLVAIFVGGGTWFIGEADDFVWRGGLVSVLVLIAGAALLFTGRYPGQLFDLILGLNRWVVRVGAYVGLMTDEYPPFRLDMGDTDPGALTIASSATAAAPSAAAAQPAPPAAPWNAGRTVLVILGGLAAVIAAGLLAAGAAGVWADRTQRDADGFLMSPSERYTTATYALSSERIETVVDGPGGLDPGDLIGTVRLRSRSDDPVFVGIARAADARAYLATTEHDVVGDLDSPDRDRSHRAGGAPETDPARAGIWVASASGTGVQTLDWEMEDGDWEVVVMNADGTRGVDARIAVGAELDGLGWFAVALLAGAMVFGALAAVLLVVALRRRS